MVESSLQHSPRDPPTSDNLLQEELVSSPSQSITLSDQEEERVQAENTLTKAPRYQMMTRTQAEIFIPRNLPQDF